MVPSCGNSIDDMVRDRVDAFREVRRLTHADLAHAVHTTRANISHRQTGHSRWSVCDLWKLAQHYHVPLSTFIPDPNASDANTIASGAEPCLVRKLPPDCTEPPKWA